MRVYLTGFMASGKSTVGPRVAEHLDYEFVDLDDIIEGEAGMPIPSIFEAEGEPGFRRRETEALEATAQWDRVVIALGGGALVNEANLAFAKAHGTVVYLRVPVGEIVRRLERADEERPLLLDEAGQPLSTAELRVEIEHMLQHRIAFYEEADVTIDAAGRISTVVSDIVEAVEERDDAVD